MRPHAKITPEIEREILKRSAEGATTRELAAWVTAVHKVSISFGAIAKLLRRTKDVRADVAAAVTREALRPRVVSDLDRLEQIRAEVQQRRELAAEGDDCTHTEFARLAALEVEVLEKRLKLAGAGGGGSGGDEKTGVRVFLPPEE